MLSAKNAEANPLPLKGIHYLKKKWNSALRESQIALNMDYIQHSS
jgi:hypothetical protein